MLDFIRKHLEFSPFFVDILLYLECIFFINFPKIAPELPKVLLCLFLKICLLSDVNTEESFLRSGKVALIKYRIVMLEGKNNLNPALIQISSSYKFRVYLTKQKSGR